MAPSIWPIGVIHWFGKKVQPQNTDADGSDSLPNKSLGSFSSVSYSKKYDSRGIKNGN
jgi:hypothetical protein